MLQRRNIQVSGTEGSVGCMKSLGQDVKEKAEEEEAQLWTLEDEFKETMRTSNCYG